MDPTRGASKNGKGRLPDQLEDMKYTFASFY